MERINSIFVKQVGSSQWDRRNLRFKLSIQLLAMQLLSSRRELKPAVSRC